MRLEVRPRPSGSGLSLRPECNSGPLREPLAGPALCKARVLDRAAQAGLQLVVWPTTTEDAGAHYCAVCHAGFATEAACAAHRAKVHQSPAPAAAAVGTARQCCMREFWSRTRLREHLRRANRCARSYNAADVGIDDQPVPDDAHLPPSPDRASAILGAIFTTASGTCSCRCRSSFLARRRCQP